MNRQSEKNLLNSNISSTCLHNMANFGPLAAEIVSLVWAHQQISTGSRLAFVTAATLLTRGQPNFARCLAVSWACALYIHFRGLLFPDRILTGAKFVLCPKSCVRLYWQRYCMALHQRLSAELCGVVQGMELRNFRRRHLYSAGRPSRWV